MEMDGRIGAETDQMTHLHGIGQQIADLAGAQIHHGSKMTPLLAGLKATTSNSFRRGTILPAPFWIGQDGHGQGVTTP